MVWSQSQSPPVTPPRRPSSRRQDSFSDRSLPRDEHDDTSSYTEYSYSIFPPRSRTTTHDQRPHVAPSLTDYTLSRPSTALSFTTRSSELVSTLRYDASASNLSTDSSRLRSPPPLDQSLPSPPRDLYSPTQEITSTSSIYSRTQELSSTPSIYSPIPSAQPYRPYATLSPQVMTSSASTSSMLPSPPLTQPRHSYFPSAPSPVFSPRERYSPRQPATPRQQQQHMPGSFPPEPVSRMSPQPPRPPPPRPAPASFQSEADDDALFNSVLDGIAQVHVTMKKDEAGRWRIRRTGDASANER